MVRAILVRQSLEKALLLLGGGSSTIERLFKQGPDHFKSTGFDVVEDVRPLEQQGGTKVIAGGIEIGQ